MEEAHQSVDNMFHPKPISQCDWQCDYNHVQHEVAVGAGMCQAAVVSFAPHVSFGLRGTGSLGWKIQNLWGMLNPSQLSDLRSLSPIIYNSQPDLCLWWVTVINNITIGDKTTQVLLILRTWALYRRNTRILLLMIAVLSILLGVAAVSCVSFGHPLCLSQSLMIR